MRKAVCRARRETKKGERRLHPPIGGHLKPMWRGYEPPWTAVGLLPRGRDSTTTLVPMSARGEASAAESCMRKQPDDCARPIDFASSVTWMRYSVSPR